MNYKINLGAWNQIFAVPSEIVDKHIKLASGDFVKILLYFLRHAGEDLQCENIAGYFKIDISDVYDALLYWQNSGVIAVSDGVITPKTEKYPTTGIIDKNTNNIEIKINKKAAENSTKNSQNKENEPINIEKPKDKEIPMASKVPPRPTVAAIAQRAEESKEIKILLNQSESILAKMLTQNETAEIVWFHDCLGLECDIILMLLKYCSNIEKTNLAYITKVAINWWENEINTHQKAQDYISRLENANKNQNNVRKVFGINLRSLSKKEKQFIDTWFNEFNFSIEIIEKAYENCVDSTGRLSFPYINKTLDTWFRKGFLDIGDIEKDMKNHKEKGKKKELENTKDSSLDLNELDKLIEDYIPDYTQSHT